MLEIKEIVIERYNENALIEELMNGYGIERKDIGYYVGEYNSIFNVLVGYLEDKFREIKGNAINIINSDELANRISGLTIGILERHLMINSNYINSVFSNLFGRYIDGIIDGLNMREEIRRLRETITINSRMENERYLNEMEKRIREYVDKNREGYQDIIIELINDIIEGKNIDIDLEIFGLYGCNRVKEFHIINRQIMEYGIPFMKDSLISRDMVTDEIRGLFRNYRGLIKGEIFKGNKNAEQVSNINELYDNRSSFGGLSTELREKLEGYLRDNVDVNYNVIFKLLNDRIYYYNGEGYKEIDELLKKFFVGIGDAKRFIGRINYLTNNEVDYNEFKDVELQRRYEEIMNHSNYNLKMPKGIKKFGDYMDDLEKIKEGFNRGDWSELKFGYFIEGGLPLSFGRERKYDDEIETEAQMEDSILNGYYHYDDNEIKNNMIEQMNLFLEYLGRDTKYMKRSSIIPVLTLLRGMDENRLIKYILDRSTEEGVSNKFNRFRMLKNELVKNKERYIKYFRNPKSKEYNPNIDIGVLIDRLGLFNERMILSKLVESLRYVRVPNNKKLNVRLNNILTNYLWTLGPYERAHIGINKFINNHANELNDPEFVALLGSDEVATMPLMRLERLLNCRENAKRQYGRRYENTIKFLKEYLLQNGFYAVYNRDKIEKALNEGKLNNDNIEMIKLLYNSGIDESNYSYPRLENIIEFVEDVNKSDAYVNNEQHIGNDVYNMGKYTFEITSKNDRVNYILGNLTGCCQVIGGLAEDCVTDGLTNPNAGFMVVYETNRGKIEGLVLQSYWWISKNDIGRKLVLDNIEGRIKFKVEEMRRNYVEWANYMRGKYGFISVVMGLGYSDFKVGNKLDDSNVNLLLRSRIVGENTDSDMYTDVDSGINLIARRIIEKMIKVLS